MTLAEAKALRNGQTIYHATAKNSDGKTAQRFKVTSVKTWKTRPDEVLIGLKRGLYETGKITHFELDLFSVTEPTIAPRGGGATN